MPSVSIPHYFQLVSPLNSRAADGGLAFLLHVSLFMPTVIQLYKADVVHYSFYGGFFFQQSCRYCLIKIGKNYQPDF